MKKLIYIMFAAMALMMLPACNDNNPKIDYEPLLGTWRSTSPADGVNFIYLINFQKDGTFVEVDIRQGGTTDGDAASPGDGLASPGSGVIGGTSEEATVSDGTWTVVGKQILLMGGGVATATSTSVELSSTALIIVATDGSHIFTRVSEATIKPYLTK